MQITRYVLVGFHPEIVIFLDRSNSRPRHSFAQGQGTLDTQSSPQSIGSITGYLGICHLCLVSVLTYIVGGRSRSPANLRVFSLFKLTVSAVFLLFFGFWILLNYGTKIFSKHGPCREMWPLREYVVSSPGCRILDLAPHEPNLLSYFNLDVMPGPLVCRGSARGELVKSTTTHLYVDMEVARNYTNRDFHCCYRPFKRLTASYNASGEYDLFVDYMNVYLDYCFPILFKNPTLISFKFVYVICKEAMTEQQNSNESRAIYEDYFTFAVESSTENWAFEKVYRNEPETESDDSLEDGTEEDDREEPETRYSVLVLGFDGMSRLNFVRQMPRTMAFFEENSGTTLLGFNKVGYNTFPNLVPILTGMNTSELEQVCWPNNNTVFDDCPFIWKRFKENGYVTAYGEDNTFVSTFSYQTIGFRSQPVDYYLKPFFVETEINLQVTKLEPFTSILCVGNKPNMVRFENAVRGFVSNMKNRPTFGVFWFNGVSHDYLNLPRIGDKLFRSMLDKLKAEGALKSTVLIGLSDHGIRWGDFRQTFQGFLEERLPLATIVLPDSFKAKFPKEVETLSLNSHRLSTPYDIYKTLLDILYVKHLTVPNNVTDEHNPFYLDRPLMEEGQGVSLFSKIPENRTCRNAAVPDEWCACSTLQIIPPNVPFAQRLAKIAVKSINRRLRNATQCELLSTERVIAVWEDIPATLDVDNEYLFSDYVINFETSPGRGRFEARFRVRGSIDERMKPKSLIRVIGFISRLNMYRNDSYCVSDPLLKLYCYCSFRDLRTYAASEVPSEFHGVVQLKSSLPQPKPDIQEVQSRFNLVDLATASLKSSKRKKFSRLLKFRTRYELRKQRGRTRAVTASKSTGAIVKKRRRRYKVVKKRSRRRATTSTPTDEIAYVHETTKLDLAVTGSNIRNSITQAEEGKFSLNGLDTNYLS